MKALLTFNIGNNVRVSGKRCSFDAEEHISAPLVCNQEDGAGERRLLPAKLCCTRCKTFKQACV